MLQGILQMLQLTEEALTQMEHFFFQTIWLSQGVRRRTMATAPSPMLDLFYGTHYHWISDPHRL